MKRYINDNTRVVVKFYLLGLATCICLQRQKWYGWKTTAWIYPSNVKNNTFQECLKYLLWEEKHNTTTQYSIGKSILFKDECD